MAAKLDQEQLEIEESRILLAVRAICFFSGLLLSPIFSYFQLFKALFQIFVPFWTFLFFEGFSLVSFG